MMMRCRDDQCCHCKVECEGADDEASCFQSCLPADRSLCGLTAAPPASSSESDLASEKRRAPTGWVAAVSILTLLLLVAVSALVIIRKRRQHVMTGCGVSAHNLSL
jgi:hypothetical protein